MTALSSVYVSMTSLLAFSRALDVISDNVANLNTPGFKATDLLFSSLPSFSGEIVDLPSGESGSGTSAQPAGRRFAQGEIRETGTTTHLAIDGLGFFVLSGRDGVFYTRAGQFELTSEGKLVDPQSGAVLQAMRGGSLADLVIDFGRNSRPSPTTRASFSGNLSLGSTSHQITDLTVYDADGERRQLTVAFTNNTATTSGSWLVSIKDADGIELSSGEIRFQGSGAPAPGFNTLQMILTAASGQNTVVELDFGTPGSFDGATSFSAGQTSTLQVGSSDGFGLGRVTSFSFDPQGRATLTFSNGHKEEVGTVALASFAETRQLRTDDGRLFTAPEGLRPQIGTPQTGGFGRLTPQSVELANVELAREFADIIILQRGYQASSQVLNVSSQLIEDVYNSLSGRR